MSVSRFLTHLFVPHPSNNHRPKLLHVNSLLFYVFVFALFQSGMGVASNRMPDVLGYATDIHLQQLLADTNAQRAAHGLNPLTLNTRLSAAASEKAQDMFSKGYWAHTSPTGTTPWDFILGAGYKYTVAGENLAKNFSNSQAVVDAWMASPSHRDNMLKSSYKEIGFAIRNGVLNGEETTLVVQMFGATEPSVPVAAKPPQLVKEALAVEELPPTPLYTDVSRVPALNIPTVTRSVVYVFAAILMSVLMLDAWIISRRKIIRVAGHNIAHILFLAAIVAAVGTATRGTLL